METAEQTKSVLFVGCYDLNFKNHDNPIIGEINYLKDLNQSDMTVKISGLLCSPPFNDSTFLSQNIDLLRCSDVVSLMFSGEKRVVVNRGFYDIKNLGYMETFFPVVDFGRSLGDHGIDVEMSDYENGEDNNPLGYSIHQILKQKNTNASVPIRHLSLKIPINSNRDEFIKVLNFTSTFCGSLT